MIRLRVAARRGFRWDEPNGGQMRLDVGGSGQMRLDVGGSGQMRLDVGAGGSGQRNTILC